jgi:hypothetical protein
MGRIYEVAVMMGCRDKNIKFHKDWCSLSKS